MTVYARKNSLPKTRRWFIARLDTSVSSFMPDQQCSRSECMKLENEHMQKMEIYGHGYGDWSFWRYMESEL